MHKCIVKLLLKWNLPTKVRTPTSSQQGHGGDGGEKKKYYPEDSFPPYFRSFAVIPYIKISFFP